jgi:hypothetical protein
MPKRPPHLQGPGVMLVIRTELDESLTILHFMAAVV